MRPRPLGPESQDLFRAVADDVRALMEEGPSTGRAASEFHGAPTQNPSNWPLRRVHTMNGGGTTDGP